MYNADITPSKIRVACIVLVFFDLGVISRSIGSIIREKKSISDRVEVVIFVVENSSVSTESQIEPYIRGLVEEGEVCTYVRFIENITNNALDHVLSGNVLNQECFDYIVVTDGDIEIPIGVIGEQIDILNSCDEVMACGLQIDSKNWTATSDIEANGKRLSDTIEKLRDTNTPYIIHEAGFWFVMFRAKDLQQLVNFAQSNGLRILDITYRNIIRIIWRKLWVITKLSIGREINRDAQHSSTYYTIDRLAIKQRFIDEGWTSQPILYQHDKTSDCLIYKNNRVIQYTPKRLINFNPIKSDNYEQDMIEQRWGGIINQMVENNHRLIIRSKIPDAIKPGVYVINKGLGASFYIKENNAFFIQMRGGFGIPPPLLAYTFPIVDIGNLLEMNIENKDAFFTGACNLVKQGGCLNMTLFDWSNTNLYNLSDSSKNRDSSLLDTASERMKTMLSKRSFITPEIIQSFLSINNYKFVLSLDVNADSPPPKSYISVKIQFMDN